MNTHPEHSLQYLRAILIECALCREQKPASAALSVAAEREINDVIERLGAMERRCESGDFDATSATSDVPNVPSAGVIPTPAMRAPSLP